MTRASAVFASVALALLGCSSDGGRSAPDAGAATDTADAAEETTAADAADAAGETAAADADQQERGGDAQPNVDAALESGTDGAADASDQGDACSEAGCGVLLPFGATCTDDAQCATSVCFSFGDGTRHCSQACTDSSSCPLGQHGTRCNGKGFCAY